MSEKKPLCPEERALSYSKYYDMPMEDPDPRSMQIWNAGPIPEETALRIENINDLFQPGYLPAEQGYCVLSDGTGFVANYVRMEGVTAEMVDWWFDWHFITPPSVPEGHGNLRYKIWNPSEHWNTGPIGEEAKRQRADSSLYYRLRNEGAVDFIEETIRVGGEMFYMEARPIAHLEDLGADHSLVTAPNFGTFCSAVVDQEGCSPTISLHYFRPVPGGMELRSRYWSGYDVEDHHVVKRVTAPVTLEGVRNNCMHNMREYPHLGRFLPKLFAEEGWKPVDAY